MSVTCISSGVSYAGLHFQIMLLDGSFIHVDIPSHITHVYCYNAKAVVFLADR